MAMIVEFCFFFVNAFIVASFSQIAASSSAECTLYKVVVSNFGEWVKSATWLLRIIADHCFVIDDDVFGS